jgi:hypothetical protein
MSLKVGKVEGVQDLGFYGRCWYDGTVEPGNTEHTFTFNINLKIVRDSLTAFFNVHTKFIPKMVLLIAIPKNTVLLSEVPFFL